MVFFSFHDFSVNCGYFFIDFFAGRNGKCRAIYDYKAVRGDELSIRVGDVITIIEKPEGGWWTGEISGVEGVFPANYVEEI